MAFVRDILLALEQIAPRRFAYEFDKVGLQVGDPHGKVERAVVSLDRSLGAIAYAADTGAQLLLAHHPLIFQPLDTVDTRTYEGRAVLDLAKTGISFIAAHTNWDCARGGVNDTLASLLGLRNVRDFGFAPEVKNLKLVFFVPVAETDKVIDAVAEAGAGLIGAYRRCAFMTAGKGTYVGGEGSHPVIGEPGRIETVEETRVEMTLPAERANGVLRALRKSHPYEEPAFDLLTLAPTLEQPVGRVGELSEPMSLRQLSAHVGQKLDVTPLTWGDPGRRIAKVAAVGGSADSEWVRAQRAGADALVTGEVKQHVAVEASESGFALIAAGHYQTEHPGCVALRDRMAAAIPDVEWSVFTPPAGLHGRPF